ncbi:MAG: aldo/keto reductase [Planctomycetia bacterium]|nr:aldo/keto reductase [Planctomycetia bacterium]
MEKRAFGKTKLMVTPLGFGSAQLGNHLITQGESDRLLNAILDAGINFIDTGMCYGDSEDKIGKSISHRRDEFVLSTKCGHPVDDAPEWSAEVVQKSVEQSLRRLGTDYLDVVLVHSCTAEQLNDEMIAALQAGRKAGKTRSIGYSGDREAALKAVELGVFDALETSVSICDQEPISLTLPTAQEAGMGVIAKRPIANACWRDASTFDEFYAGYARPYAERLAAMGFTPESLGFDGSWVELALRFSAYLPGVHCAIIGSTNVDHVLENAKAVAKGPLPEPVVEAIRDAWAKNDDGSWHGRN